VDAVLRAARARAEQAGWHCWAYRNELAADEITLFLEGPRFPAGGERPIFDTEIQELRALASRFERVRSLVEYPLDRTTT
jgi:hypothetical protein